MNPTTIRNTTTSRINNSILLIVYLKCTSTEQRDEQEERNNLPRGSDRTSNGKQLRHRCVPQELTQERQNDHRDDERENGRHDAFIRLLAMRRTGQVCHALDTRQTETL